MIPQSTLKLCRADNSVLYEQLHSFGREVLVTPFGPHLVMLFIDAPCKNELDHGEHGF